MADLPFSGEVVQPWDPRAWDALADAVGAGSSGITGGLIGGACTLVYSTAEGLFTGFGSFLEGLL